MQTQIPQNDNLGPRRLLRRNRAAAYVSLSETKFDQLVTDGRLPKPARVDGCVLWDIRRLDAAVDLLVEPDNDTWAGF